MSSVTFLTQVQTAKFIRNDPDGYCSNFSHQDLCARGVSSKQQYIETSASSSSSFNVKQKQQLTLLCTNIDTFLMKLNKSHALVNLVELARLPWIFALTSGNTYECGLPHTRQTVIFLSNSDIMNDDKNALIELLIHEKIHVYQRVFKDMFIRALLHSGFKIHAYRKHVYGVRSNPDLDEYVYEDSKGNILVSVYTSECPASIRDATHGRSEHPNEMVAYKLAEQLSRMMDSYLNKLKSQQS